MALTEFTYWGPAAGVAASACWALGVVAYSALSEKYPPYIVNFTRVLIGLPLMLFVLVSQFGLTETWAQLTSLESTRYGWLLIGVLCSYAFGDVLFFESARRLGGTSALALASVYPVWAAMGGWIYKGDPFHILQGVGVAVVVAGTILVIMASSSRKSQQGMSVEISPRTKQIGVLLGLATSVAWAMNSFAVSKGGEDLSVVLVNAVRLAMALVLAPVFGVALNGQKSFRLIRAKDLKPFLVFFFVESFFGPLLYMYGLTRSPLAVGAVLTSLAPVMTVPVAVLLKTEKFSWPKLIGVLLVVSGIWALLIL